MHVSARDVTCPGAFDLLTAPNARHVHDHDPVTEAQRWPRRGVEVPLGTANGDDR